MRTGIAALGCLLAVAGEAFADSPPAEALGWLQRISSAAQQLNYSGTFVYQHGNHVETSRIVHVVDATGEYEKLESLDGPRREIIRSNDQIAWYLPESKLVRIEKRSARKFFPGLLPAQLSVLTENYHIRKGETARIAGLESQSYVLEPKDAYRYGHKLWAATQSGLLLKARMFNDKNEIVEQFTFTQVSIGGKIGKDALKPSYNAKAPDWRFDHSAAGEAGDHDTGWFVRNHPSGFRKVLEVKRAVRGRSAPVSHLVFSDGLVAVSVFVEPLQERPEAAGVQHGVYQQGAINVYSRTLNDHLVTVIGEAPAVTVMQIGNSVAQKAK